MFNISLVSWYSPRGGLHEFFVYICVFWCIGQTCPWWACQEGCKFKIRGRHKAWCAMFHGGESWETESGVTALIGSQKSQLVKVLVSYLVSWLTAMVLCAHGQSQATLWAPLLLGIGLAQKCKNRVCGAEFTLSHKCILDRHRVWSYKTSTY